MACVAGTFCSTGALLGFALLFSVVSVDVDDYAADGFGAADGLGLGCLLLILVLFSVGGACESANKSPMPGGAAELLRARLDGGGGGVGGTLITSTGFFAALVERVFFCGWGRL